MGKFFAVMALMFGIATFAGARESISFGFGIGHSAPVYAPVYTGGHYETHYENVLVSPDHYDRVQISDGKFEDRFVPAQYESRPVTVWVADGVYYGGPYYYGRSYYSPSVRLGFSFGHSYGGGYRSGGYRGGYRR